MKGLSHTYTCIHSPPNTPLIQAAPHNTEQSSMCYRVDPFWLFKMDNMELVVKNLHANAGNIRDGGLGREDPLEEDKPTHLGFLA